jgi:hypothetical protein
MGSDLRDRLEDLATHTPLPVPPTDLWDRGVRRRRLDVAVTTVVVAVLVSLICLSGWSWQSSRPVRPADTRGTPHLPDRFYLPSPWLPAFDGAPGQLVAVGTAPRKTLLHTRRAVYGVTASTGEYGFLDLGDVSPSELSQPPVAVSPDGGFVAYWLTAHTTQRPNTEAVGGVGVYNTVSGTTRFFRLTTAHGLAPGVLLWTDDRTLVLGLSRWSTGGQGGAGRSLPSMVWSMSTDAPTKVRGPQIDQVGLESATATDGLVVVPPYIVDPTGRHPTTTLRGVRHTVPVILSPALRRLVTLQGRGTPTWLTVQSVRGHLSGGVVDTTRPLVIRSDRRVLSTIGWVDAGHVAALTRTLAKGFQWQVDSIDVRTGATTRLIDGQPPVLAAGLLAAPPVHADAPPRPWDRRWLLGGAVAGLVVVGLFVWSARGRRA